MSLRHLPTRLMVSVSSRAMKRSTLPAAQMKSALMSSTVKFFYGTADCTMALVAAVMSSPWICFHLLPFLKLEIGVLPVAPWRHKYATW